MEANERGENGHWTCQLSQVRYLFIQVSRQLLWRQWCVKQTHQLHAQAHLHVTGRRKNTVTTKTLIMRLLIRATCQQPHHSAVLLLFIRVYLESEKDCNACHDLWNNTLFCLAEQNIWLYFLAYRQIINNSHLIPSPPLLPPLPLFLSSPFLHFPIQFYSPFFSYLISYLHCRQYDLRPCQMPRACYLCRSAPVST